jgi:hypothetical protein
MAAQKGYEYEKNVANYLKKVSLVKPNFNPVGSMSNRADLELFWKKQTINVELKIEAASGGSLVLKWDASRGKGKQWGFADTSNDPEKNFLAELATDCGALKEINRQWTDIPLKRDYKTPEEKMAVDKIPKDKRYEMEKQKFPEINDLLDGKVVAEYYALKDTYYINVGTHGFYLLGTKDPHKLNEECRKKKLPSIPSFSKAARVKYRARVQDKGGGNFQYTFELSFSLNKAATSPYNIGPCSGGGNVTIQKNKANISFLL